MNVDARQGDSHLLRFLQNRGVLSAEAAEAVSAALQAPEERRGVVEIVVQSGLSSDVSTLIHGTQLPPVVKLLNLVLVDGIRSGASDVHIEASLSEVRVRYRIDGVLHGGPVPILPTSSCSM